MCRDFQKGTLENMSPFARRAFAPRLIGLLPWSAILLIMARSSGATTASSRITLTLDDLVQRVELKDVSVSPNGRFVAFAEICARVATNDYQVSLYCLSTSPGSSARQVARYVLPPERLFEGNHSLCKGAVQTAWSPTQDELLYTDWESGRMRLWTVNTNGDPKNCLRESADLIEFDASSRAGETRAPIIKVSVHEPTTTIMQKDKGPFDLATIIDDQTTFSGNGPPENPRLQVPSVIESFAIDWATKQLTVLPSAVVPEAVLTTSREMIASIRERGFFEVPWRSANDELTVLYRMYAMERRFTLSLKSKKDGAARECFRATSHLSVLGPDNAGQRLFFLENAASYTGVYELSLQTGKVRTVSKSASYLWAQPWGDDSSLDAAGRIILLEGFPARPNRLVALDVNDGTMCVLHEPNPGWDSRALPQVRYLALNSAEFYPECGGRLYLPHDYQRGVPLPLVFTSYGAFPNVEGGVGDELPVIPLTEHGIAVFDLRAVNANRNGSVALEIARLQQPVLAMERVIKLLSNEGIVDPRRVGVQGVSYGSEIATSAWWRSSDFQAVSCSGGGFLAPELFYENGRSGVDYWTGRGFGNPDSADRDRTWGEMSAALHARPTNPPFLLQVADGESLQNTPGWTRARGAGAPIEWLVYPNEGHVKRNPANRWWVYSRNLDWFRFWLKDEEDPNPQKAEQYARWRKLRKLHEEHIKNGKAAKASTSASAHG